MPIPLHTTFPLESPMPAPATDEKFSLVFNVLKNGCRIEALQPGSVAKLELALTVYMVVARRLARLVRLGRTHPDLSASALLTEAEWKFEFEPGPGDRLKR